MDDLNAARKALRRGRAADALVHLWNAVEPARLAGDTSRLRALAGLAARVARNGDDAERREAERLLAELSRAMEDDQAVGATERMDAQASVAEDGVMPEYELSGEVPEPAPGEEEPDPAAPGRRAAVANLVWLLLVLGVIVLNVLRGLGD